MRRDNTSESIFLFACWTLLIIILMVFSYYRQSIFTESIAITASTTDLQQLKQRCLAHGFAGYMSKPYAMETLLETLAENLQIELHYDVVEITEAAAEKEMIRPPQNIFDQVA